MQQDAITQLSDRDALLVIDVQNDFVSGSMAVPGAERIIGPINRIAARFANLVIATDWHPADHVSFASAHPGACHGDAVAVPYGRQRVFHDHCVQESWGAELAPGLRLSRAQLVLRKGYRREVDSFSCFYENDDTTPTGLGAYLRARSIERVFCTGLARFGCVMASALGAARDGLIAYMVEDASAGRETPEEDLLRRRLAEAGVRWLESHELMAAR